MADNGETMNLAKEGRLTLAEVKNTFSTTETNPVSVVDWNVCYDPNTGQLSEFCTVNSNNPSNPITGIGMLLYSVDGTKLYAAQYTNFLKSISIGTSVGTTLYTTNDGDHAICIIYGWTDQGRFYLTEVLPIGSC